MNRFSSSFDLFVITIVTCLLCLLSACDSEVTGSTPSEWVTVDRYALAHGCYALALQTDNEGLHFLTRTSAEAGYEFTTQNSDEAQSFRLQPSDLGTYLLFDSDKGYLITQNSTDLSRATSLQSDITLNDDSFISPAEWVIDSPDTPGSFRLQHRATTTYLSANGLTLDSSQAASFHFIAKSDCSTFAELPLNASGTVSKTHWDDGELFGYAELHSHMLTNFGFGGGGIFHGATYHRLGVEHALHDCSIYHGTDGRRDLVGYFNDGDGEFDTDELLPIIANAELPEFYHHTQGYPDFTDWPNAWKSSTHQAMYYRFIERAWLSGMRLVIQHATGNSVLCDFVKGIGAQQTRYDCNDMVSVDRSIEEAYRMQDYIDAQHGGPNKGWFRIVESPEQARNIIAQGKLAVVLGIEISNLFNCFLTYPDGTTACNAESLQTTLDEYYSKGVRVLFPVHKYDNAFSPGDGDSGIIELGNVINSGHYNNFTPDCPQDYSHYDGGNITFAGLNQPRDEYLSDAPLDMSGFAANPLAALLPYLEDINQGSQAGDYCQATGLTELGRTLITQMMAKGMIVDIGHLPERSLQETLDILTAADYPVLSTHGNTMDGQVYRLGGMIDGRFNDCAGENPGNIGEKYTNQVAERVTEGGEASMGFGFDMNGFAHGRRPRFGENSRCQTPQANPVQWPFTSFGGDITFEQPTLGKRDIDFNTEGLLHIGLLPELIEDARRDGMSDEELKPLFRSAEGFIRIWEKAESKKTN